MSKDLKIVLWIIGGLIGLMILISLLMGLQNCARKSLQEKVHDDVMELR